MKEIFGKIINGILGQFDLMICRRGTQNAGSTQPAAVQTPGSVRSTLWGTINHAKDVGFYPKTVIDVGAATGTYELYETFPDANHLLVEPLEENRPWLEKVKASYKKVEYVIAAATRQPGEVTIHVHPDLVGSSLYLESEDSDVNGVPRTVPAFTLDQLCAERTLEGPYLIKVDVQGAELDVLAGATRVLEKTEFVVLECSLFGFFVGGPQVYEVISFMKEHGFVIYDVFNYNYRLLDGAMSQVDMSFVRDAGEFRRFHFYATQEQREKQNRQFREARESMT